MVYSTIPGGFQVSQADLPLLNTQRAITKLVNDQFIQVGAVFLKTSGKNPIDEDWFKSNYRDTDLQSWIDTEDFRLFNVGFNLQLGWMDIDIDAGDPEYNECMVAALQHNGVDTRFRFGRRSVGHPTHILVQLGEEEASNFEELSKFQPKEFRIKGQRFHTELRSYPTNTDAKNAYRSAKQTVMPGSIYLHKTNDGEYDISVWYDTDGNPAEAVQRLATTTPRKASFNQILRSIAFATFLYSLRDQMVEGNRQHTMVKVAGWLARVVKDGQAMNNHESISADVFCPVDTDDIAEALIGFVCDYTGDDEKHMRIRTYRDAVEKLDRNPDAKIPGWPAMTTMLGAEMVTALRATFTPGSDISVLTKMAERYIYDETDNLYIDRERHARNQMVYVHEAYALERRHIDETVMIKGKPKAAFNMFETSKMRSKVAQRNMYPDLEPGVILRVDKRGAILPDDAEEDSDTVFNTWRGWPILPPEVVDHDLLNTLIGYLDRLFGYLTCDNADQIQWIKEWVAWTFQHPADKQQIAWVCVGGQGVGKSFAGNILFHAIMGQLWGTSSASIIDNKFNVGPFVDKMLVFIDEVKFHNESGTDEVKKLIRNVDVPGMLKYGEGGNFKIYARMFFASNTFDMAIGQKSVIDRALFYTKAYDKGHLGLTDTQFRAWTETLKPWFTEFANLLERMDVKQHLVHYFMTLPTDKQRVESISLSSSTDADIVNANMRPSRRFAKAIIEGGKIHDDLSIEVPFSGTVLANRIRQVAEDMNTRPVATDMVINEWRDAGILGKHGPNWIFKFRIETLIDVYGEAINSAMDKRWEFDDDDRGPNDPIPDRKMAKDFKKTRF